jgi:oleandomycin transport system permease protein
MTTALEIAPRAMNPARALQHGLTLTWRSLVKTRRNPEQLADVTFQPIIFTLLFVFVFGGAIGGDWRTYLQFVLPGLLVQSVIFSTLGTGVGLNTDIDKGVFDRFRSLPIARSAPLVGAVLGDAVRYAFSICVMIALGAALGFDFTNGAAGAIAGCLLVLGFALALCWVWVWLGLTVKTAQGVQGLAFLVMFPLTFGSNVFVPTTTLPSWMQAFVNVNPVRFLVDAARGLMLGGPVAQPLLYTVLWCAGLLAVFVPLALRAYRRRT